MKHATNLGANVREIMETLVQVEVRNVYGVTRYYPANMIADVLAQLIGQKTFSEAHLSLIRRLGYRVEAVHPTLPAIVGEQHAR